MTRALLSLLVFLVVTGANVLTETMLVVLIWSSSETSFAIAQVTTTVTPTTGVGRLGTTVTADGNYVQITGGTRPDNGTNLFHSFDQFSVGPGDTAQFLNTTPSLLTSNILSRIIGGDPSSIFGTIDATSYPGANLFLVNPAGIVFGPNATLNVSGSVAFTTADYLRLANADGSNAGIFHADPTATSLLTSASVAAFGFLDSNPSPISLEGSSLQVQAGHSIALIGGNITVESEKPANGTDTPAGSTILGGQVYMASMASSGEILPRTLTPTANVNGESPGTLGTVKISKGSTIDTSESGGGAIRIRGGRLTIDGSNIFAKTGDISIDGTTISFNDFNRIVTFVDTPPEVKAGDIVIAASEGISMTTATVESQTSTADGDAGNITFRSTQGDVIFNEAAVTSQSLDGGRNTGSIQINAQNGNVRLENSAPIFISSSAGSKKTGGVTVTANNLELLSQSRIDSDNFSPQEGADINIQLRGLLSLDGSSEIETVTNGTAPAADIVIQAQDISITDGSGLSANTITSSSGAGGRISIKGSVGPSTLITIDGQDSGIITDTNGIGPGGTINLSAQSVRIQNGGRLSAETTGTSSKATGGSIIINATDQLAMTNGASITASSTNIPESPNSGIADAGNISVNAGQQLEMRDSSITAKAEKASGGNIDIQAVDRVRLVNSEISSSVQGDASTVGGNITIDPDVVVLQDNSKVTAQAVQGAGGNITIFTPLFLADPSSVVSASSQFGLSGSVTIQSPTSNLSGTVGQLASKTSPPQVLLQNRCVALAGGEQSTFILAGRDALPSEPGGWLSSPVAMEHWTGEGMEEHASGLMVRPVGPRGSSTVMTQAQGTEVLSLRRLTPSGFLVRSFAESALTGCRT